MWKSSLSVWFAFDKESSLLYLSSNSSGKNMSTTNCDSIKKAFNYVQVSYWFAATLSVSVGGWAEPVSMLRSHEAIHHVTHVCPIFSLHYVYRLLLMFMAFKILLCSSRSRFCGLKSRLLRKVSNCGIYQELVWAETLLWLLENVKRKTEICNHSQS